VRVLGFPKNGLKMMNKRFKSRSNIAMIKKYKGINDHIKEQRGKSNKKQRDNYQDA
jgi:hypothetical protein